MHCLDCRAQGTTGTAVGVWHEHTLVANRVVRGGVLLGRPGEVTARTTIRCTPWAAAQAA